MKEYIDREATLNECPEGRNPGQVGKEEYNKGWNDCRSAFYKCITSMPTADVVEVRHGYWIDHHSGGSFCFACKRWVPYSHHPKYCETCGARMEKEDEHEVD